MKKSQIQKEWILHKILVKAGLHEQIEYAFHGSLTSLEWIDILAEYKTDEQIEGFLWGYNYYEAMISDNRSMTQKEYKFMMHTHRRESFEMDKNYDDSYYEEPQYNPGGGPYHLES